MALCPNYKIYENNNFIDVDGVFEKYIDENNPTSIIQNSEYNQKIKATIDNFFKHHDSLVNVYKNNGGKSNDSTWIVKNFNILKIKKTIEPKAVLNIQQKTTWFKKRYFKNDENEYYLDQKNIYYLELGLVLLKNELQNRLTIQEFEAIKNDKNFLSGVFISNKMKIDFGD